MNAKNINITTQAAGNKNEAIVSQQDGSVKINAAEKLSAESKGNNAYTIYAWGGDIDITSKINEIKSDYVGIAAFQSVQKYPSWNEDVTEIIGWDTVVQDSSVKLEADNNIITAKNYAVYAKDKSSVSVISNDTTQMTGNVYAENKSVVGVNYDSQDSFLKGYVKTVDATTNLDFTDNARWKMTGNSNVTNLKADNAFINMKGNASTLTVDNNFTGTGSTFVLDLDAANKNKKEASTTSDYIYLNGNSGGGAHNIYFDVDASKISTDMNVGDKLYFAYVKDGKATFDSAVDLEKVSAENIYDYKYGVGSDANEDKSKDWYIGLADKTENENVTSVDGAMKAGYALGTEMDRLNKRLGESRYLSDEKGLWVRYRHARVGMDNSFKTNSNMFQLGYDKQVLEDDGTHYRGLAFDYTHGDTSLLGLRGNGEHDRYSLSLYDTWTGDKGHYRDLVIRGGRINSEFDVDNSNSKTISSDYHQWFGSISGEWGRKKDTGHDWYFEPQTQLQLARVGGADYVTNHGVRVEQDGATSLIGRLGFRLGREFDKNDAAKRDNYYIKADLMHEFCGDQEYRVTGTDGSLSKTYDGKDTWFDVGVGADITISRNTYFWVDVERTLGGDFDRTWQVNGGFRWEF
ncbi:autotransporter outer membrane beta-barrel domain-containing protein [uncultured Phascolarctobacterium sp.]|uniref:autotransporter outer membrane beta-barrel domain-containing protein n=1 Tax=uncultured Phascolarctobacterium sp. TaxID=512296 RepID=UPI0026244609|nr:autotransporter outer membrane beta-barrel domain-containing protein [uncultured Phascolarctobacterium sp.]